MERFNSKEWGGLSAREHCRFMENPGPYRGAMNTFGKGSSFGSFKFMSFFFP